MKNVYIAMVVLVSVMAFGQLANAGDTLEKYYAEYANEVGVIKAHKVEKRAGGGWDIYPYGDDTVGYYNTQEQYCNAYDSAIFAQD